MILWQEEAGKAGETMSRGCRKVQLLAWEPLSALRRYRMGRPANSAVADESRSVHVYRAGKGRGMPDRGRA